MSRKHRRWAWLHRKAQTTVTLNITAFTGSIIALILGVILIIVGVIYASSTALTTGTALASAGAGAAFGISIPTIVTSA